MGKTNEGKANKGERWSEDEVSKLIAVWGDEAIQKQLDGTTRNGKVFTKMSECLLAAGYKRTPAQCREKLKSMKKEYKKTKDHNRNQSGGNRKTCPFYDELDAVLGCRHSVEPAILFDTATPTATHQEDKTASISGSNFGHDGTPEDEDMPSDDDSENAAVNLSTSSAATSADDTTTTDTTTASDSDTATCSGVPHDKVVISSIIGNISSVTDSCLIVLDNE